MGLALGPGPEDMPLAMGHAIGQEMPQDMGHATGHGDLP